MHTYIEQPATTKSPESEETRELREQLDELREQNAALGAIANRYKAAAEVQLQKAEVTSKVLASIEQMARDAQQLNDCRTMAHTLAALADQLRRWEP